MLLDAGADVDLPWARWDIGRRPLALAARCGHLDAYELLAARGATADLDPTDTAVLAVARGESVRLPTAPPPALGLPAGDDYGWILGQFALLGRTDIVRALLGSGMHVDTRRRASEPRSASGASALGACARSAVIRCTQNRRSAVRLAELRPRLACFGHGFAITDPGRFAAAIEKLVKPQVARSR